VDAQHLQARSGSLCLLQIPVARALRVAAGVDVKQECCTHRCQSPAACLLPPPVACRHLLPVNPAVMRCFLDSRRATSLTGMQS
jgi:hypothetical protein